MRCGKKLPIFWWEAPDGSRVLAFNSIYNGEITAKDVVSIAIEIARRYGIKSSMYLFGVGDHGGGPTRRDILVKMELDKRPALPNLIFSSSENFYDEALKERTDYPVIKDALGLLSSHIKTDDKNRENLPSSFGLLNLEQSNLVVSGLKKTEDDKGIILRFYEVEGKKTTATLISNLPFVSCTDTNLLEEKERNDLSLVGEKVQIEVLPFEIRTLRLQV